MPGFRYQKPHAGIRFNVDVPELALALHGLFRQLHINFPLEFPFGIQMRQGNAGMGLGEKRCGNQDISNRDRMLKKIRIVSFLLFFRLTKPFPGSGAKRRSIRSANAA
jgi:hypothetical protein